MPETYLETITRMRNVSVKVETEGGWRDYDGPAIELVRELIPNPTKFMRCSDKTRWGLRAGAPSLELAHRIQLPGNKPPLQRFSIITATSKMACGSFSLPAGPFGAGGTCLQAANKKLIEVPDLYVCMGCYAIGANYKYTSTRIAQAVSRHFVEYLVKNIGPVSAAEVMVEAIRDYNSKQHWKTSLGYDYLFDDDYFRIHDSGDLAWLGTDYVKMWMWVAEAMSDTTFWSPTRDYHNKKFAEYIQSVGLPDNLILRPSALHIQDLPPVVRGFDAGASVAYSDIDVPMGQGVWDCPAYASDDGHTCANTSGPGKEERCRACWDYADLEVNYAPHGVARGVRVELIQSRMRSNPLPSLVDIVKEWRAGQPDLRENSVPARETARGPKRFREETRRQEGRSGSPGHAVGVRHRAYADRRDDEAWRSHDEHHGLMGEFTTSMVDNQARVERNPPELLESKLERMGLYPFDYTDMEWAEALPELDFDQVLDFLHGSAEWQPLVFEEV